MLSATNSNIIRISFSTPKYSPKLEHFPSFCVLFSTIYTNALQTDNQNTGWGERFFSRVLPSAPTLVLPAGCAAQVTLLLLNSSRCQDAFAASTP